MKSSTLRLSITVEVGRRRSEPYEMVCRFPAFIDPKAGELALVMSYILQKLTKPSRETSQPICGYKTEPIALDFMLLLI